MVGLANERSYRLMVLSWCFRRRCDLDLTGTIALKGCETVNMNCKWDEMGRGMTQAFGWEILFLSSISLFRNRKHQLDRRLLLRERILFRATSPTTKESQSSGAKVEVSQGGIRSAVSDIDGLYEIRGLLQKPVRVFAVKKPGYLRLNRDYRDEVEPGTTQANFTLDRMATVTGTIIDAETGDPIQSYEVALEGDHEDQLTNEYAYGIDWTSMSGTDGAFRTESRYDRPSEMMVIVRSNGYRVSSHSLGMLEPNDSIEDVVIELTPGGQVEGVVRDYDGSPIAGARIYPGFPERLERMSRLTPLAISGRNGQFQMESVPPGENSLTVVHPEFSILRTTMNVRDESETPKEIILGNGAAVEGTVLQNGTPLESAYVAINIEGEFESRDVRTEENGTFLFERLPPGEVRFSANGYRQELILNENDRLSLDVHLPTATSRIEGVVVADDDGGNHWNARVDITFPMGNGEYRVGKWTDRETKKFVLESVPAGIGELNVVAHLPGGTVRRKIELEVGEGESISMEIEMGREDASDQSK